MKKLLNFRKKYNLTQKEIGNKNGKYNRWFAK